MVKLFVNLWMLVVCLFACSMLHAQNVTNITAEQVDKKIHVSYDLDMPADITLFLSTDGGETFTELHCVSGDVGKNIAAGHKTIVWDVLSERDSLVGEDFVFKVKAEGDAMVLQHNKNEQQSGGYCTFFTLNSAYSPLPQWSYGFKVGGVKTWGWYVSLMSNFNFNGMGEPFQTGNVYMLSGESRTIRFSAQAGLVCRPCKPMSIILGVGYGYRTITYRSKILDYETGYSWRSYPERTFEGVDVSCGMLFNIKGLALSAEAVTTNFQTIEARVGAGFCLSKK